jgi:hypothetical protein
LRFRISDLMHLCGCDAPIFSLARRAHKPIVLAFALAALNHDR